MESSSTVEDLSTFTTSFLWWCGEIRKILDASRAAEKVEQPPPSSSSSSQSLQSQSRPSSPHSSLITTTTTTTTIATWNPNPNRPTIMKNDSPISEVKSTTMMGSCDSPISPPTTKRTCFVDGSIVVSGGGRGVGGMSSSSTSRVVIDKQNVSPTGVPDFPLLPSPLKETNKTTTNKDDNDDDDDDDDALARFGDIFLDLFKNEVEEEDDDHMQTSHEENIEEANEGEVEQEGSGEDEDNDGDWNVIPSTREELLVEVGKLVDPTSSRKTAAKVLYKLHAWLLHSPNDLLSMQELVQINIIPILLVYINDSLQNNNRNGVDKAVKFIDKCTCSYYNDDDDDDDDSDEQQPKALQQLAEVMAMQFVQFNGVAILVMTMEAYQDDFVPNQPCLFKTLWNTLAAILEAHPCTVALLQDPHHEDQKMKLLDAIVLCLDRTGHDDMTAECMKSIFMILNLLVTITTDDNGDDVDVMITHRSSYSLVDRMRSHAIVDETENPSKRTADAVQDRPDEMVRRLVEERNLILKCRQVLDANDRLRQDETVVEVAIAFFYACYKDLLTNDEIARSVDMRVVVIPFVVQSMKAFRCNGAIQGTGCLILQKSYASNLSKDDKTSDRYTKGVNKRLDSKSPNATRLEEDNFSLFASFLTDPCVYFVAQTNNCVDYAKADLDSKSRALNKKFRSYPNEVGTRLR